MFEGLYDVPLEIEKGGHGGGDPKLLEDLFGEKKHDEFNRAADPVDGITSILTGISANISRDTGQGVNIKNIVEF